MDLNWRLGVIFVVVFAAIYFLISRMRSKPGAGGK
jgi:hypothetical protein